MTSSVDRNTVCPSVISGAASGLWILLFFAFVPVARAQAINPARDAAAISTLQSVVAALGGIDNTAAIQSCIVTGTVQSSASNVVTKNFTWTTAGKEFRKDASGAFGTSTFTSGNGAPASVLNGSATLLNYHVARANLPFYLPAVVLFQELSAPNYTLKYVGSVVINGVKTVQVHISDDSDAVGKIVTPQEWYFDAVSFLPLRVQFRQPSNENANDYANATFNFSQYGLANGVLFPLQMTYSQDNSPDKAISVSSVNVNPAVSTAVFDAPKGVAQ